MHKLENNNYEIINDDYVIYISKELLPNLPYIYFIDVFNNQDIQNYKKDKINIKETDSIDNEPFDELWEAIEYLENNYQIPKTITKQIKFKE